MRSSKNLLVYYLNITHHAICFLDSAFHLLLFLLLKYCCAKLDDYIHDLETVTSEIIAVLFGAG